MSKERKPGVADPTTSDESFLERWSRRKKEARDGPDPAADDLVALDGASDLESAGPEDADSQPVAPAEADSLAEDAPGDEDMPSIEDLTDDDDYSAFFSPRVSPGLRKKALARLFRSPKFNIRDGLDDYDDDYTMFKPLGGTITAEMRHRAEDLLRRQAEAAERAIEESPDKNTGESEKVAAGPETRTGHDSSEEPDGSVASDLEEDRQDDT
jgi:hypothetical protein